MMPDTTKESYAESVPTPTLTEVPYGDHERHVLDLWLADSDVPTPLVIVIHGGGWVNGSKERLARFVDPQELLAARISVAAINYRLINAENTAKPPVKAPLHDAARALQFVRSKATEWNFDTTRIGAAGGSAGACSSLWLAYHADMADPTSSDPIARESTQLTCVAVRAPQTTLDPQQMVEWTPNSCYCGHAFGLPDFADFLASRETILPWIQEYSPYALVRAGAPPVALFFTTPPALGQDQADPTHTANFGVGLHAHCQSLGATCHVVYPDAPDIPYETPTAFLIATLST